MFPLDNCTATVFTPIFCCLHILGIIYEKIIKFSTLYVKILWAQEIETVIFTESMVMLNMNMSKISRKWAVKKVTMFSYKTLYWYKYCILPLPALYWRLIFLFFLQLFVVQKASAESFHDREYKVNYYISTDYTSKYTYWILFDTR